MACDTPQSVERRALALAIDFPGERCPEELQELWRAQERRGAQLAHRLEDGAGRTRADVDDLGPDHRPVEEDDGLLEEMGEGQEADDTMGPWWHDHCGHLECAQERAVGQLDTLGLARGPGREDDFDEVRAPRARPALQSRLPVRWEALIVGRLSHQLVDGDA